MFQNSQISVVHIIAAYRDCLSSGVTAVYVCVIAITPPDDKMNQGNFVDVS